MTDERTPEQVPRRWLLLPDRGALLISTDLHGNGEDFRALCRLFLDSLTAEAATHWAILGDSVHAPDEGARRRQPELYDYPDKSLAIVEGILDLQQSHPRQVHYVLGNHDWGHVGGPHTHKFYPDEVLHLEETAGPEGVAALRRLFEPALLAVVAPCGALLAHGSPSDTLRDLDDLNGIVYTPAALDEYRGTVLEGFLCNYGQRGEVTERLLATVSRRGVAATMVIHGHDRDEAGFFIEGGNQLCPVIFGAPRRNKRYVRLDLARHYGSVRELREGLEILRLYPG
jgi:hypothetical protein